MFIFIIAVIIFCCVPWYVQLVFFAFNLFFPDPIPILDELLMIVSIIKKLKRAVALSEIIRKYGKIILAVGLTLVSVSILWVLIK